MSEARLATHMLVASLVRRAFTSGDTAAILVKGDESAGGLIIIGRIKGAKPTIYERMPTLTGLSKWTRNSSQHIESEEEISDYLARRCASDRDLWVLELDVAFQERLIGLLAD